MGGHLSRYCAISCFKTFFLNIIFKLSNSFGYTELRSLYTGNQEPLLVGTYKGIMSLAIRGDQDEMRRTTRHLISVYTVCFFKDRNTS